MKKIGLIVLMAFLCSVWTVPYVTAADEKAEDTAKEEVKKDTKKKSQKKKTSKKKKSSKKKKAKKAPAQVKQVNQCELAQKLVQMLGLSRFLPANPDCTECFAILMANGIVPADGWNADKVVTKADLAQVVVQAMGKEGDVKDKKNPAAYVDYLKGIGVPIDSVGEAVSYVPAESAPLANNVANVSTDPLVRRQKFNPIDETQFGVDMVAVNRILSDVELASGELRPKPVTPN